MTKPELLRIMRLLSAAESLLRYKAHQELSDPQALGHFLAEIAQCTEILEREILK